VLKRLPWQRGVSLVEVMIGLAVAAILLAMGAPSFSTFIQNTHVRNAAEAIQNGLSLARAEAVRRNTGVQFTLGNDFSWTIGCEVPVGDNDGDGVDDCPATIFSRPAAEGSSKAAVATSELDATTKAPSGAGVFTNTLAFNGLGKEHTLPPGDIAVFDISNPMAGACQAADGTGRIRCLRVTVSTGGEVRMCDPQIAITNPPNPQGC
jgi:type IV fimbrial biogenesis protein FimT